MKNLLTIYCMIIGTAVFGQTTFTDTFTKDLKFDKADANNVLYLSNINGSIIATPGSGSTIKMTVKRTLNAKTESRMQEAKKTTLGVKDRYDTLIVFVEGACGSFNRYKNNWHGGDTFDGWGYNWNNCKDQFDFKFDITLEVPVNQHLILTTVNKGDVDVADLNGDIQIRNVNGNISIKQATGSITARTINGDVDIKFKSTPTRYFSLYTLNGDIRADYPNSLNADISFKSYNGEFFTNEKVTQMPMKLRKEETKNEHGIKYKIAGESVIRFNNGGLEAKVETFNGDVYLTNLALKN